MIEAGQLRVAVPEVVVVFQNSMESPIIRRVFHVDHYFASSYWYIALKHVVLFVAPQRYALALMVYIHLNRLSTINL